MFVVTPEGQLGNRGDSTWDCLGVVTLRLKPCGNMTGDRADGARPWGERGPPGH